MRKLVPVLLLTLCATFINAQIVINEISSFNGGLFPDEDSTFYDWVELYNSGTSPVNIGGYSLSDDNLKLDKWQFPNVEIAPGAFLTVYASGKNSHGIVDHWETAVKAESNWKYVVPSSELDPKWGSTSFNDNSWLQGKGGFGFDDGDDQTLLTHPMTSVYIRAKFFVSDPKKIMDAVLHVDYDDGFVAYLNGVEITRSNVNGYPPKFDGFAAGNHEARAYNGWEIEKFNISSSLVQSLIVPGNNVLAIQGHNVTAKYLFLINSFYLLSVNIV